MTLTSTSTHLRAPDGSLPSGRNMSAVTVRIHDHAGPVAVRFVLDGTEHDGAGRNGLIDGGVDIVYIEMKG